MSFVVFLVLALLLLWAVMKGLITVGFLVVVALICIVAYIVTSRG